MNIHMKQLIARVACPSLSLIVLFCTTYSVRAEGGDKRSGGNWGVNRRVLTDENFTSMSGNFLMDFGHVQKVITKDDRKIAAYTQETIQDRPSPYVGGGIEHAGLPSFEVDAGFQFNGLFPNTDSDEASRRADKEQGWTIFMRSSTAATKTDGTSGYCNVSYYDPKKKTSTSWTDPWNRKIDAFLGYRVYGGDDKTTTVVEEPGWVSITTNILPVAGGGNQTIYWRRIPNIILTETSVPPSKVLQVQVAGSLAVGDIGKIDDEPFQIVTITSVTVTRSGKQVEEFLIGLKDELEEEHKAKAVLRMNKFSTQVTETSTVSGGAATGTNWFTVNNYQSFELGPAIVGTEPVEIIAMDDTSKKITIRGLFGATGATHPTNNTEVVRQSLDCARAYPHHPVAPWRGTPTIDSRYLRNFRVKRVIALTRRTEFKEQLGGSWLTSVFSNGTVRQGPLNNGNPSYSGPWEKEQTLQTPPDEDKMTGYDAPSNNSVNDGAWDQRTNDSKVRMRRSKTIVEFPNLRIKGANNTLLSPEKANIEGRTDSNRGAKDGLSKSATEEVDGAGTYVSRYTQEHVNINLLTAARLSGEEITIPHN